jgi:glycosyltransferase involved in cell wall biosynthesis
MQEKKIWIVNQYAGSPGHGMEFRHYYLAKALIERGHSVHIISGSYSHLYTKLPEVTGDFTFEKIEKINYCWVRIPSYEKSGSLKRIFNMAIFAWKLKSMPLKKFDFPDVILVSSPSLFPIVKAKKWARKFGAKLFFEVRDIWPLTLMMLGNISSFNPIIKIMQWFENYGYKSADKIISLLPGAKVHMLKHGMKDENFFYLPNGIDTNSREEKSDGDEEISGIPEDKFIVGYAGTLGVSNAMSSLVEAARLVHSNQAIHFVVVGSGYEKERLIKMSEGLSNISFLDAVSKKKVSRVLKKFDVCYIGWRKESLYRFGISANKIFDYMFSAKPVIHAVEAFNDPIAEANCGISVEPQNPYAIVEAINKLIAMPVEDRERLGENGRKYVIMNHSYKVLAEKLESLF